MRIELTRRGDYAIRAMVALARAEDARPMSVPRMADEHGIPPRYLSAVMARLLREGLVVAVPGRRGGYRLSRSAGEITVLDVLRAVEGPFELRVCVLRGGPCGQGGFCDVHDVFSAAQGALSDVLEGASLATLPVRNLAGESRPVRHAARTRTLRLGAVPVYVEVGSKRTFAGAIDWPGWCRSGRDEEAALRALSAAGPRYAAALGGAATAFEAPGSVVDLAVVERLVGNSGTDFGVPSLAPAADARPLDEATLAQQLAVLAACWAAFDRAVAAADGLELRKGPRGGGRDLARIVEHVAEAEQAYLVQLGASPPRAPAAMTASASQRMDAVREATLQTLAARARGLPLAAPNRVQAPWAPRYHVRRAAWHVLDHAWEIEDRTP